MPSSDMALIKGLASRRSWMSTLQELLRVRESMCSLPQYMAAAHRGQVGWGEGSGAGLGEVAQVLVRYDRNEMQVVKL